MALTPSISVTSTSEPSLIFLFPKVLADQTSVPIFT